MAGHEGKLFRYTGSEDFTALWIDGDHSVTLRGAMSEAEFRSLTATVVAVDIDTWLDAMPDSVVAPLDRNAVIDDMLSGIQVPTGFDETIWEAPGVSDRYQLGALVSGSIACAWFDMWVAADARGDVTAKRQAADAMATSRTWRILLEMEAEGAYPQVLWEYADDLANDGISTALGRDTIRTGEYLVGLGCER